MEFCLSVFSYFFYINIKTYLLTMTKENTIKEKPFINPK